MGDERKRKRTEKKRECDKIMRIESERRKRKKFRKDFERVNLEHIENYRFWPH
jgi:hypothetical protein